MIRIGAASTTNRAFGNVQVIRADLVDQFQDVIKLNDISGNVAVGAIVKVIYTQPTVATPAGQIAIMDPEGLKTANAQCTFNTPPNRVLVAEDPDNL